MATPEELAQLEQILAGFRNAALVAQYQAAVGELKKQLGRSIIQQSVQYHLQMQRFEADKAYKRSQVATINKQSLAAGKKYAVAASMKAIAAEAEKRATSETAHTIGVISKVYSNEIRNKWAGVSKINLEVGRGAQQAMLDRYDEVYASRTRPAPYRLNERFAGGKLRASLMNPGHVIASPDGVNFLETSILDQSARQWARLNFGAGEKASSGLGRAGFETVRPNVTSQFFMTAVGETLPVFDTKLPYGPRGGWILPGGFFAGPSGAPGTIVGPNGSTPGQNAFFTYKDMKGPLSRLSKKRQAELRGRQVKRQITAGTAAWGFLEAGVGYLAANLPAANAEFMAEILESAGEKAQGLNYGRYSVGASSVSAASAYMDKLAARYSARAI